MQELKDAIARYGERAVRLFSRAALRSARSMRLRPYRSGMQSSKARKSGSPFV